MIEWLLELRALLLAPSHNLQVIFLGVTFLGCATGFLGCFLLFRKKSLISDTVGHATLPGITLAFLLGGSLGFDEKNYALIALGGMLFGWFSSLGVKWLQVNSKIKADASLAINLTFFYAIGIVVKSIIPHSGFADSSGLEYYMFGMVASMVTDEALLILWVSLGAIVVCSLFFKELNILCFDEDFARVQGLPRRRVDEGLMFLCLLVAIIGMSTVGLLLVMAMFIIPPATARLWTQSMRPTLIISALCGALGACFGVILSATITNMPAGAAIIVSMAVIFALSLLIGLRKGILVRKLSVLKLERRLAENQFLRAAFDNLEHQQQVRLLCGLPFSKQLADVDFNPQTVVDNRCWKVSKLRSVLSRLKKQGAILVRENKLVRLTRKGMDLAIETARTHRLTELYLLEHSEVASLYIHQFVEQIEEITTPEIARELNELFEARLKEELIPLEPHEKPLS